ncbi:F-BAR domain only protein 2-like isoform X12 [Portunus trituberculatus]|uniref:F-BAR domain only protein 2-like isoform X12 n=1 Tax=Portunus trituberculatus TaxID=210409 RepID=UPI001E1CF768|nr:F-BAR domain only protein 2-like isoform X12 [Portunus trituberculatus]
MLTVCVDLKKAFDSVPRETLWDLLHLCGIPTRIIGLLTGLYSGTGEEHNGWNVLYQNMKQGQTASKELAEFFKERWSIDETYSKSLVKLANKANSNTEKGTYAPIFGVLRQSSEKLSSIHSTTVQRVQELVKEVVKYNDELHKKHKVVKDEESQTEEIVKSIQATSGLAQKAKETYGQRCQDLEKVRRDGASPKELEKAEAKLKKAHDEYRSLVDKYNNIREEFEKRMTTSCMNFQSVEETHLVQMLKFVNTYICVLQSNHEAMGQVHQDLLNQCSKHSVEKLLDMFALSKHTGLEKPNAMVFEESESIGSGVSGQQSPEPADQSKASVEDTGGSGGSSAGGVLAGGSVVVTKPGFLRSRRDRKIKEKKVKKKKDADSSSNKEEKSDNEGNDDSGAKTSDPATVVVTSASDKGSISGQTPNVDEEGFSVRPQEQKAAGEDNSFDSSSDTDSDAEPEKKIHVEIKPISNGNAPLSPSVDELRATIEGMSLSPASYPSITSEGKSKIRYLTLQKTRRTSTDASDSFSMKRSYSITQPPSNKSSSVDLLGLNLNFGNSESPRSTAGSESSFNRPISPVSKGVSSPAPSITSVTSPILAPPPRADRYAELSDILNETEPETPPALPPRTGGGSSSRGSTPTPTMAIPRPPSRKSIEGPARGRQSPSTVLPRAESVSSLEFRTSGMMGTSRGPSPLTIGLSDTIPLAVAFQELCHAYFRGTDESRCQVKVTGEMMVSFPAGIVGVLANNPSPAQLSFKVNNIAKITNVLPNKQLITMDEEQSTSDYGIFNFNMNALTSLLRKQAEGNPSASYFNVDMIKYQVNTLNGATTSPLQLVSYWKCEDNHTDLRIDYKYNPHALASPSPLLNVNVMVPVDGIVKNMQSKPQGQWLKDQQRAVWKLTELSPHSTNNGVGSLRGKFEVAAGPSTPATVSTQFNCEGTTISGLEFNLLGSGYRVSLVKKRFVSGKYICDADAVLRLRYGSIPS